MFLPIETPTGERHRLCQSFPLFDKSVESSHIDIAVFDRTDLPRASRTASPTATVADVINEQLSYLNLIKHLPEEKK